MTTDFFRGVRHGIPIALGYISVSFGFGIMAVRAGLSPLAAVMISVTNLGGTGSGDIGYICRRNSGRNGIDPVYHQYTLFPYGFLTFSKIEPEF